jgi:hypothetical protein
MLTMIARVPGTAALLVATCMLLVLSFEHAGASTPVADRVGPGPHAVWIRTGVWTDRDRSNRTVLWKLYLPEATYTDWYRVL